MTPGPEGELLVGPVGHGGFCVARQVAQLRPGRPPKQLRGTGRVVRHAAGLACDPAALARDTAAYLTCGYRLLAVRAFDAFGEDAPCRMRSSASPLTPSPS